jgi:uncharacterized protein (TIGR02996 family)
MTLDDFLQAIVDDPHHAATTWLVLADWLEDQDDPRAELVRLMYQSDYRRELPGEQRDERLRELLASGVGPVSPTLINSIGIKLVLIPAGTFMMGSPDGFGEEFEHPQHEVEITRPFFMGSYQVTQEEYQRVIGSNPSYFCATGWGSESVKKHNTKRLPVENVSWDDVTDFCEALSLLPEEKNAGHTYRLPTEAEWEYACRGGATSHTPYSFGAPLSSQQGNFYQSKIHKPRPVANYAANGFGLFDMHGNVWEWCLDRFDENYYKRSPQSDPEGAATGDRRVMRGGSWKDDIILCRSATRMCNAPGNHYNFIGFRVALLLDV